ncbi:MAG TPA: hypothetical protein VEN81_04475 [Planctomycetota bacterium]|nr:hypothetical protein [Planctomycetota bacterium]
MILGVASSVALTLALQGGPYDSDPHHPWNELHRALFTWHPAQAGQPEVYEEDPRCWPIPQNYRDVWTVSKNLSGTIDRFGEHPIQNPLKRAMLQHDLWMFLDGLDGLPVSNFRSCPLKDEELKTELRRRLVPILRQLALGPEEIRALPDTYAQAVQSKAFAPRFDLKDPGRPFLPPDLWEPEGPWVLLGDEKDAVLAEQHVKLVCGRSVFFIFIALPGGRRPTLDYVKGLREVRRIKTIPPPPPGTRVILVRRALLLDPKGQPYLSPLTEEIRIRASLKTPAKEPSDGLFEFHLIRSDLFNRTTGGLRAAGPEEEGILPMFQQATTPRRIVRTSCSTCHASGAILQTGFQFAGYDDASDERLFSGVALRASTVERETEPTVRRQRNDGSWATLGPLWPKD